MPNEQGLGAGIREEVRRVARATLFRELQDRDEDVVQAVELAALRVDPETVKDWTAWARGTARNQARQRNRTLLRRDTSLEELAGEPEAGEGATEDQSLQDGRESEVESDDHDAGVCFNFQYIFRRGGPVSGRISTLCLDVSGPGTAVDAFCETANLILLYVDRKRRKHRWRDARALLAWAANRAGDVHVRLLGPTDTSPDPTLEPPRERVKLARLSQVLSFPGGVTSLTRLITAFNRFCRDLSPVDYKLARSGLVRRPGGLEGSRRNS